MVRKQEKILFVSSLLFGAACYLGFDKLAKYTLKYKTKPFYKTCDQLNSVEQFRTLLKKLAESDFLFITCLPSTVDFTDEENIKSRCLAILKHEKEFLLENNVTDAEKFAQQTNLLAADNAELKEYIQEFKRMVMDGINGLAVCLPCVTVTPQQVEAALKLLAAVNDNEIKFLNLKTREFIAQFKHEAMFCLAEVLNSNSKGLPSGLEKLILEAVEEETLRLIEADMMFTSFTEFKNALNNAQRDEKTLKKIIMITELQSKRRHDTLTTIFMEFQKLLT